MTFATPGRAREAERGLFTLGFAPSRRSPLDSDKPRRESPAGAGLSLKRTTGLEPATFGLGTRHAHGPHDWKCPRDAANARGPAAGE